MTFPMSVIHNVELYLGRTLRRQIETLPTGVEMQAANAMTQEERRELRRNALLRAAAIVQRYQDENWRRLRVNDICTDIKRLINDEAARWDDHVRKDDLVKKDEAKSA